MFPNRPWPVVTNYIHSKYNVLAEINLFELDSAPHKIYDILKASYKNRYQPTDRILIYHYDTDFYYTQSSPGFTVYNLLNCLKLLDIPVCFCMLLTNHYGIAEEINQLSNDSVKMTIFESNYQLMQTAPKANAIDVNIDQIKQAFINLNGAQRPHRILFLSYLKEHNLLDKGILSWHFNSQINTPQIISDKESSSCPVSFVSTRPFSRINTDLNYNSTSLKVLNNHAEFFKNQNYQDSIITSGTNQDRFNLPEVQTAFLYVSVETVFEYPYPYLTEKTFRAILHKRPFVIAGAPGSIEQLHKLGFKTFNEFWDESYDDIDDPNKRIQAIVDIIKHLSSFSIDQLQQLMYSIKDTVEFNYNFYVNEFSTRILQNRLQSL